MSIFLKEHSRQFAANLRQFVCEFVVNKSVPISLISYYQCPFPSPPFGRVRVGVIYLFSCPSPLTSYLFLIFLSITYALFSVR